MSSSNGKLRKSSPPSPAQQRSGIPSIHWLFRSNIPRRRTSYISVDIQKRNFFGMGEILGVLTNPAETVRSLTESKRLLDDARREINENKERSQIRPKHTFSRLPGFFPRKAETQAIERALEGEPSFTVLFGASSVGKASHFSLLCYTALLREVLTREEYHVLHFDLRIAGFADLASLYTSLSQQMEQYFEEIATKMEGYQDFEREAWSFKHDRLNVERRFTEPNVVDPKIQSIKTSDVARLMELFQSSLLKYWEFQPKLEEKHQNKGDGNSKHARRQGSSDSHASNQTRVERTSGDHGTGTKSRWGFRSWRGKASKRESEMANGDQTSPAQGEKGKEKEKPAKKMPVIFFDEAHKLPALIQSTETMKCLLDSMLVLTKQDRLCHVIHATSDPFYQTWLRQMNVMQHCKIITIGDCSKGETRKFFRDRVLPRVPERLRGRLDFEVLYDAFGGKLAHWHDYITDYVDIKVVLAVKQSSHFLQAHALLNLHIIHSSQAPTGGGPQADGEAPVPVAANTSTADTLHPGLGPAGFKIYSPLTHPHGPGSMTSGSTHSSMGPPEFSAMELLKVMSRLSRPDTHYIPYFHLCRELGVRTVDGMVKGRVLDLRWTETVTRESGEEIRVRSSTMPMPMPVNVRDSALASATPLGGTGTGISTGFASGSAIGTDIDLGPPPPIDEDEEMVPVSERLPGDVFEEIMEVVGPKLVPTTPIMRFAMRDVVQEYEDDQSVSEYASLSDVDEY
ncbi:hypothetical protein GALMADRAFT_66299 [Galerina marginata CBS 339.88]|uniref:AAA+ ATPase domain-containing protein n=1 Tax=Galerina marginata (strain CBS 339.88) TaxID=685588 RepID=A0A067T1W8_GALM3|nr:hypothetical protein GALMADRAFT_66299 [Galerina marginata CBS 339.88]